VLSDPQFVGRFKWSATTAADYSRAITASEWIGHLRCALRAVEEFGLRLGSGILRSCPHEEKNSNTKAIHIPVPFRETPINRLLLLFASRNLENHGLTDELDLRE